MEATDRRAAVLRAIVEEYVQTAQPVASQSIAQTRSLGVSSATVRNDMTQLERDGYIHQPHTSAGRVPTDLGYRYFVDHFANAGALAVPQRRAVADFFATAHSALEDLLHETSQLLAGLTSHAAVVVGPGRDTVRVRSAQLVAIQPDLVLAIAVLSNGSIEKEVVSNTGDFDDQQLARASAALDAVMREQSLTAVHVSVSSGDRLVDELVRLGAEALTRHASPGSEPLYVGGASKIVGDQDAFATAERAARLLEMLEQQVVVVSLVRDLLDQGVTVSIGSEHELDELRDCSIVLAPYAVDGQTAGTVGVLGPTRMDYQQALAAVTAVSQQLGRLLLG
jgi:heat-inducible transcriptional repressor